MGMIFGQNTNELEERIEELESRLDQARAERDAAREEIDRLQREANGAKAIAESAVERQVEHAEPLNDLTGTIETLDQDRIAWKATRNHIVKLLIPQGARVVHPYHDEVGTPGFHNFEVRKKRTDKAVVVGFYNVDGYGSANERRQVSTAGKIADDRMAAASRDRSMHDDTFTYEVGEEVEPEYALNTNLHTECHSGIHIFATKDEALAWYSAD